MNSHMKFQRPSSPILLVLLLLLTNSHSAIAQDVPKLRIWKSSDGKVSIRATFVSFESDKIRLRRENGTTFLTDPANLCESDQTYLAQMRNSDVDKPQDSSQSSADSRTEYSVAHLRAKERKLIYARDILALYQSVKDKGGINAENGVFVENKIKKFKPLAKVDAIDFINEFVPKSEVPGRRKKATNLVSQWINAARAADGRIEVDKLREATETDPISLDAAILEGMHYYFFARDYQKAMRSFKAAMARGKKYQSLHSEADKNNWICALSGCAVLSVRARNFKKAYEHLNEIAAISQEVPNEVRHNLLRIARLARLENAGIDITKSESLKFEKLFDKLGLSVGGSNGWFFINPYNQTVQHKNLKFLLGKYSKGVSTSEPRRASGRGGGGLGRGGVISGSGSSAMSFEDFVCLLCEGTGQASCPNAACNAGVVKVPTTVWVQVTPYGDKVPQRKNISTTCKVCGGTDKVRCWGCEATGIQRK